MVELYSGHGFDVTPVLIPRYISSKADTRVPAGEIVVRPAGRAPLMLDLGAGLSRRNDKAAGNDGSIDDKGEPFGASLEAMP